MMYSAYKLNKQGDNIQPCCTSFPILNQSIVPCPIATVAPWPAYWFLRRQLRWSVIPLFKNFPQFVVIHTVKSFSIVSEAETDVFYGIPLLFFMIQWMLGIWSDSSAFSKLLVVFNFLLSYPHSVSHFKIINCQESSPFKEEKGKRGRKGRWKETKFIHVIYIFSV